VSALEQFYRPNSRQKEFKLNAVQQVALTAQAGAVE